MLIVVKIYKTTVSEWSYIRSRSRGEKKSIVLHLIEDTYL